MTKNAASENGSDERISWLNVPDEETLDDDLKSMFAKARENVGFLPNVLKAYTLRPERLRRWIRHFNAIMYGESELSIAEREMIAVAVSTQNHCLYCLVSHGGELRKHLGDEVLGDRIIFDYKKAGLDERMRSVLDFAVKLTNTPADVDERDLEKLRGVGFSDEGIFDIAETTSMYNFTNRMASASGMLPNREYHQFGRGANA